MTTFIDLFRKHLVAFNADHDAARSEVKRTSVTDLAASAAGGPAAFVDHNARRAAAAFALAYGALARHRPPAPGDFGARLIAGAGLSPDLVEGSTYLDIARDCFAMGQMAEQLLRAQQ